MPVPNQPPRQGRVGHPVAGPIVMVVCRKHVRVRSRGLVRNRGWLAHWFAWKQSPADQPTSVSAGQHHLEGVPCALYYIILYAGMHVCRWPTLRVYHTYIVLHGVWSGGPFHISTCEESMCISLAIMQLVMWCKRAMAVQVDISTACHSAAWYTIFPISTYSLLLTCYSINMASTAIR